MKTTISVWLSCLLLWVTCAMSASANPMNHKGNWEYSKTKEFHQQFTVKPTDLLQIDNRYGNVTVVYWAKNEVDIRVEVQVDANQEKKIKELLDRVDIRFNQSGGVVSAFTEIESQQNNGNYNLNIHYYVQMPKTMNGKMEVNYGNVYLPDNNEGAWALDVKYGNIQAGNFTAPLQIVAKYTNVDIRNVYQAEVELEYTGNSKIGNAEKLMIDGKYSTMSIGDVKQLELSCKFGGVELETVDRAEMSLSYSNAEISSLKQILDLDELSYSTLNIRALSDSFTRIDADARYGNLKLRLPEKTAFTVEADDMKYGDLEVRGFHIDQEKKEDKDYYYYEVNGGGKRKIRFSGNNYSHLTIRSL